MRALAQENRPKNPTFSEGSPSVESLPLHLYHAVIQQLKQQKHELPGLQMVERKRVPRPRKTSAQVVLSNLSSGVLSSPRMAWSGRPIPRAKEILGFASPGRA